jgi:hypothetical protein
MVEKTADQIVNRAIQNLEASTTVYLGSSTTQTDSSSSSASSSHQNEAITSRFGSQRSSSNTGLASSSLLSRLRANRDGQSSSSAGQPSSIGLSSAATSSSSKPLSNTISRVRQSQESPQPSSSSSSNLDSGGRGGIVGNIRSRLNQLFDRYPKGLKTENILEHFRDLGDQYAPLFKQTLRSIAQWNGTVWKRM